MVENINVKILVQHKKNKLQRDSHSNKKKHNTENNIESKNLSSKNIEKKDKKAAPKQIEEKTVNQNNDKKKPLSK